MPRPPYRIGNKIYGNDVSYRLALYEHKFQALAAWQNNPMFHPLTCTCGEKLIPVLEDGVKLYLRCDKCSYIQEESKIPYMCMGLKKKG